ncbi:NAD(P)H-binding protein [Streptomyces sp. H27-G5]|uniref:NAD(P)H-binding protein n=1 Tax=Streptomyces sp. H27-G5 TaxID=2996698 RepID=UPI0022715F5F|nr:NAD(P)H-binding protein [Streptomyces sp. H27-G5]MCY0916883.1 NAD(P)H-binding protein [Streptomyces sp. H27-G5]
MTILVTGARGRIGRAVVDRLHAAGTAVRAASATPAELAVPAGVDTVELALNRPETFAAALAGIRRVFLYPEPAGIHELVEAAGSAGVEHVVLLSSASVLAPGADTDPLASHSLRVERALADAPFTVTLLRPDAFAGNALGWAHPIGRRQPVRLAHPDAALAPIHPDDIADIAVRALTGDDLAGRAITLTGPRSLTFREQLAVLSDVLGRDIPVEEISRAEAEREMGRYMPAPVVGSLLDLWAAATVTPVALADTTETLFGTPARTFARWARENAAAFAGH